MNPKDSERKTRKDFLSDVAFFRGDNGHVTFALPWLITWYSHVLEDLELILRLYDLFIVSHYLMPIYLAAQVNSSNESLKQIEQKYNDLDLDSRLSC